MPGRGHRPEDTRVVNGCLLRVPAKGGHIGEGAGTRVRQAVRHSPLHVGGGPDRHAELALPGYPEAGITPSCCIMLSVSIACQGSTTLPPATWQTSILESPTPTSGLNYGRYANTMDIRIRNYFVPLPDLTLKGSSGISWGPPSTFGPSERRSGVFFRLQQVVFFRDVRSKRRLMEVRHASVAITFDTYSRMLPGVGGEAGEAAHSVGVTLG